MDIDIITDSYSAEVISLMLLERAWSKVRRYLDAKAMKHEGEDMEKRISKMETDIAVNSAIDKHVRK